MSSTRNLPGLRILANWSILILYGGAIFVLSSMSVVVKPSFFPHLDKVIHASEFGIFSILLYRAMQVSFLKAPVIYLVLITLFASASYGAIDEYHQFFTPSRTADVFDLIADTVGILIAQVVILTRVYLRT